MRKMKELIKNGSTVIFVSHDMHAVKFFCRAALYSFKMVKSLRMDIIP